ncbi:type II toxin-antitoxin system RelB/DinJ family antitoxin [bacterium]|jgi:DNA-damage-inducible protein J|nr:type II toxin-antitoxin system RelB/DinJ family antitoxin [bacterium]
MAKEATVRARVEEDTKTKAEEIITKLGMTTSQVINMLYQQIILNKGLPFEVKVPNAETIAAMNEDVSDEKRYESVEEMFKDLDV